jgi:hypothetical protein
MSLNPAVGISTLFSNHGWKRMNTDAEELLPRMWFTWVAMTYFLKIRVYPCPSVVEKIAQK